MRIRQVKPDFWTDEVLAALPEGTRLFYIGLWQEADDSGFFRLRPSQIAAALYPYVGRARREAKVVRSLALLMDAGRVEDLGCGHGRIPALVKHQHFAGATKQVHTIKREHDAEGSPAATRGDPPEAGGKRVRKGPDGRYEAVAS